jgi:hypothetical protein
MKRRRPIIFGVSVMAMVVAGGAAVGISVGNPWGHPPAGRIVGNSCMRDNSAFITTAALPGFDVIVSQHFTEAPVKGVTDPKVDYIADFSAGATVGFIADIAVKGPYRESEDTRARALGYPIGEWPYVPLIGEVVSQSNALLEVYETVTMYTSPAAARDWTGLLAKNLEGSGATANDPSHLPEGSMLLAHVLGPDDGSHEYGQDVLIALDRASIRVSFQYSPSADVNAIITRVASSAIQRFAEVCGLAAQPER